MGLRQRFEEKIRKKEQEIQGLENQLREAKAYLQALYDSIRLLPREEAARVSPGLRLKPDSDMGKAYAILKNVGKPLHITEILKGIGKEVTRDNRISLSGSLGRYAKNREIFVRTAPNTFGLIELETTGEEPPEDFGLIKPQDQIGTANEDDAHF